MRIRTLLSILIAGFAAAAFATVSAPTSLTVTLKKDSTGASQWFHIAFAKPAVPRDSNPYSYYYAVIRWKGTSPDTTGRKQVATLYQYATGDSVGTYDDKSSIFNLKSTDSNYSKTYSYSVYTIHKSGDSTHGYTYELSSMVTLVTGTLDTPAAVFKWTEVLASQTSVQAGDTILAKFSTANGTGSVVYRITSATGGVTPTPSYYLDSTSGYLWVIISRTSTTGYFRIAVSATDAAGHILNSVSYLSISLPRDSLIITLKDPIATLTSGSRCFYALIPVNPADSVGDAEYGTKTCNAAGQIVVSVIANTYKLYVQVEGFNAAQVSDPLGGTTINASGNVTVLLNGATTHTLSGKVTGDGDAPLYHALVNVRRGYGFGQDVTLAYVYTDSSGNWSATVAEGDTMLKTQVVYAMCTATSYSDSTQWFDHTSSAGRTAITVTADKSDINFSLKKKTVSTTGYASVRIKCATAADTSRYAVIHTYQWMDSLYVQQRVDTIEWGIGKAFSTASGKYIFFAEPNDTGYLSGYYKYNQYAATWSEADTVTVNAKQASYVTITLSQDSTIVSGGGVGSPIAGVVSGGTGPVAGAHLLLYQVLPSQPSSASTLVLMKSTVTNASGAYTFPKITVGTYEIDVDIVGMAPFKIAGIYVDETGSTVNKDINLSASGVDEGVLQPSVSVLSQNYPNPFTTTTSITFDIRTAGPVDLSIVDMSGRRVAELVHGYMDAGAHSALFSGSLRPGVYACQLRSAGSIASALMTVVR